MSKHQKQAYLCTKLAHTALTPVICNAEIRAAMSIRDSYIVPRGWRMSGVEEPLQCPRTPPASVSFGPRTNQIPGQITNGADTDTLTKS